MNQEEKYIPDEIDLMDYVKIIIKRKVFILTLVIASIVVTGIFTFFSEKIYQIDLLLEIGEFNGKLVESPSSVMAEIEEGKYKALIMEEMGMAGKDYPEIEAENTEGTRLLKIMVLSSRPDEAKYVLEKNIELVFQEHQKIIDIKKAAVERELAEIENTLDLLKTKKIYADKSIADLQLAISAKKGKLDLIEPSRVVYGPNVSEDPVEPRPMLNIAIASVLGLFIGVFIAFGREWWLNSKD